MQESNKFFLDSKKPFLNEKLLTNQEILTAKNYFLGNPNANRLPKKVSRFKFTVIKLEDTLYAIYSGKEGKALKAVGRKKVKLMQNLHTGERAIIKIIMLPSESDPDYTEYLGHVENEVRMSALLEKGLGYIKWQKEAIDNQPGQEKHGIGIKLEPGISLDHFIKDHLKKFSLAQRFEISIHILKAVQQMHQENIIHRDIKPGNIMIKVIEGRISIKIIDYEVALKEDEIAQLKTETCSRVGAFGYMAPEILIAVKKDKLEYYFYTKKSDIYATGITLSHLFYVTPDETSIVEEHILVPMCDGVVSRRLSLEAVIKNFELLKNQYAEKEAMNESELTPLIGDNSSNFFYSLHNDNKPVCFNCCNVM